MTFTDAAREVLRQCGRPLHYKEITEIAIEKNLLSHVGKSPEVTMGARLAATLKKGGDDNPLVRVKPGVFALRDWDDETIKAGLEVKRSAPQSSPDGEGGEDLEPRGARLEDEDGDAEEGANGEAAPFEGLAAAVHVSLDDTPRGPDEEMRAEIAASAMEVFAEEDDDDQPIMRSVDDEVHDRGGDDRGGDDRGGEDNPDGRRRRRRRRRRGLRGSDQEPVAGGGGLPTYTATPAYDEESSAPRGPQVIELSQNDGQVLDGLAGRELADAVVVILGTFDRTVGAVSLRQITDTAQRRGRLLGEQQMAQSHIAAAVRADNARRQQAGMRPRFRLAGGRVGLTDWLLDGELARFERELGQALHRYREASRRAFMRKTGELPGHAFIELVMSLLEKVGVSRLHQVKFPGASGAEAHFAGVMHLPAGSLPRQISPGDGLPLGVVVRRDGRDLGRERVTELRGAAHHYDSAQMGWIFTTGQVLSGAREEAIATGVMPVALIDGAAMARLCEEHGVATLVATHPVAIPDVDFFEGLRSS